MIAYFRLVMSKVSPLFNVDTFEDIIRNTKKAHKDLKELGCFESVDIKVDTLPDVAGEMYEVCYNVVKPIQEIVYLI